MARPKYHVLPQPTSRAGFPLPQGSILMIIGICYISDDEAVELNERFIVIIEVTGKFSDLVELTLRLAELNDDGKD